MFAAAIWCDQGQGPGWCIFQRGKQSTKAEQCKTVQPIHTTKSYHEISTVQMALLAGEIMKCFMLKWCYLLLLLTTQCHALYHLSFRAVGHTSSSVSPLPWQKRFHIKTHFFSVELPNTRAVLQTVQQPVLARYKTNSLPAGAGFCHYPIHDYWPNRSTKVQLVCGTWMLQLDTKCQELEKSLC